MVRGAYCKHAIHLDYVLNDSYYDKGYNTVRSLVNVKEMLLQTDYN